MNYNIKIHSMSDGMRLAYTICKDIVIIIGGLLLSLIAPMRFFGIMIMLVWNLEASLSVYQYVRSGKCAYRFEEILRCLLLVAIGASVIVLSGWNLVAVLMGVIPLIFGLIGEIMTITDICNER